MMRAKMRIDSVTLNGWSEEIKLQAVCGTSKEDNSYSEATPSGELRLTISNKALHGKFKPGQKFYLDFTEAPE